jgi:ribosomal protein S18 acetylase RimI-like enzyme
MSLHIRTMTLEDTSAGMRLKELAGWNQTEEDWHRFLEASPDGCFVAEWSGRLAGTVATIIYGNVVAWIGMVLVDPQFRGKGIGTALLTKALDDLSVKRIPCVKLDATPEGRPIYERQGFRVEYAIERQALKRPAKLNNAVVTSAKMEAANSSGMTAIESILAMDRESFGSDRGALLRSLGNAAPDFVIAAQRSSGLDGYALGRKGSRADHLGPWVAYNASAARDLLEAFLDRSRRDLVFVDVVKENPWAPGLLAEHGFQKSRSLTRMYRGQNVFAGQPNRVCAILGPEFG